jgi:hypothetical protein
VQLTDYRKNYHPYRLTPKQRVFLQRWEKKRKQPQWKYILYRGVLKEAMAGMLAIKAIQYFIEKKGFADFYLNGLGIGVLVLEVVFWLGAGAVIGWLKHRSCEAEYEMLKSMEHF